MSAEGESEGSRPKVVVRAVPEKLRQIQTWLFYTVLRGRDWRWRAAAAPRGPINLALPLPRLAPAWTHILIARSGDQHWR